MSVGDYVSVKIPTSNKIVAGLVEEINGNNAIVRLRSSSDAKSHNRDETVTVPTSSLQSLGVSSSSNNNRADNYNNNSTSPTRSDQNNNNNNSTNHLSPSSSDYTGKSEDCTDPFKNFDFSASQKSVTVTTENSSPMMKERQRREAAASFHRHGIFSKYVWEFFSPVAALLRCDRPLFTIGFFILFLLADACRTAPFETVSASCFLVSRIIRDQDGRVLPSPSSTLGFLPSAASSSSSSSLKKDEQPTKQTFEQVIGKQKETQKRQRDRDGKKPKNSKKKPSGTSSSNNKNNDNNPTVENPRRNTVIEEAVKNANIHQAASSSSTTTFFIPLHIYEMLPGPIKEFFISVETQIEDKIIFPSRILLRDAGLFTEDLWMMFHRFSSLDPTEDKNDPNRNVRAVFTSSSLFGRTCSQLKKKNQIGNNNNKLSSEMKDNIQTLANRLSQFLYCIILCFLWSQGVRCSTASFDSDNGSNSSNNYSSSSLSNTNNNEKTPEELARAMEVEEENRLLDDAEDDGSYFEDEHHNNSNNRQIRFRLKTDYEEYRNRHQKMKTLEVAVHYPDLALKKFLKEFHTAILIHLFVICFVCFCSFCFRIVETQPVKGGAVYHQIVYAHPILASIFSPAEDLLIDIAAALGNLTLESWLLQSLTVNAMIGALGKLVKFLRGRR